MFAAAGEHASQTSHYGNLTDHGPQLLHSEIHPHVCTEATLPTGSFWPVPEHTDGDATSLFPRVAGLLCVTADFRLLGSLTVLAHPPPCPALPCPELPCLLPLGSDLHHNLMVGVPSFLQVLPHFSCPGVSPNKSSHV